MSNFKSPLNFRSPLQPVDGNKRMSLSSIIAKTFRSAKKEEQNQIKSPSTAGFMSSSESPVISKKSAEKTPVQRSPNPSTLPSSLGKRSTSGNILEGMFNMEQIGAYDSDMHLPKYSQSEMDAAIEENSMIIAELNVKLSNLKNAPVLHLENQMSSNNDHEVEVLKQHIEEEKKSNASLRESLDEYCLLRTQNKALNHRLQVIEDEQLQRESMYERKIAAMETDFKLNLQAAKERADAEIAHAYAEVKKELKAKAVAQFEAGNAKFNEIKQDFKDLRAKYDEKLIELKASKDSLEQLQLSFDSEQVTNQARNNEVEELKLQIESLKQDKSALIQSSLNAQVNATATQEAMTQLRDEMRHEKTAAMEAKVTVMELENQLRCVTIELEGQMNAIAKLTSAKNSAERQVELQQKEIVDLNARCLKLREMNKEMLAMLESEQNKV